MQAYNLWLHDYISEAPTRLYGVGQSAVRSVKDAISDLYKIKELGFRSAMLPNMPSFELDYDHPDFDPLWKTAVELGLPISFHILTGRSGASSIVARPPRGGKVAGFCSTIRECQDVVSLFVFGKIFERHPDLKIVCVEADGGWVPHFASRMDNAYKRHHFWMKIADMPKLPSEYVYENIYFTFQDDWVALENINMVNPKRMLWANDFPHSDSTWPWSHKLLARQMEGMTDEQVGLVLRENVKELYQLEVDTAV
jgi:predicted TIM-barrel fold metal-dependent hydrolase